MISLDIIMPFSYALCFYLLNSHYPNTVENPITAPNSLVVIYLISAYSKGILLLIAGCFLGDSMRRIKNAVKELELN